MANGSRVVIPSWRPLRCTICTIILEDPMRSRGDGCLFNDEAAAASTTQVAVDASRFSVDDGTYFGVPVHLPSPLRRQPLAARSTLSPMRTVADAAASVMPLFRCRRQPTVAPLSPSGLLPARTTQSSQDDAASVTGAEGVVPSPSLPEFAMISFGPPPPLLPPLPPFSFCGSPPFVLASCSSSSL